MYRMGKGLLYGLCNVTLNDIPDQELYWKLTYHMQRMEDIVRNHISGDRLRRHEEAWANQPRPKKSRNW